MDKILFDQIPDLFASVGNLFIEKKEELCEMDARLGDGDLGLTMSKGYGSLPDIMREEATGAAGDIGKLLMKSGMKMSSLVPSTNDLHRQQLRLQAVRLRQAGEGHARARRRKPDPQGDRRTHRVREDLRRAGARVDQDPRKRMAVAHRQVPIR